MKIRFQVELDDTIYAVSREVSEEELETKRFLHLALAHEINEAVTQVLKGAGLPEVYVV